MEDAANTDELVIASKSWNRAMEIALKTGYREGVDDGLDAVLQNGFDVGYAKAFKTSFALGVYKSLVNALPEEVKIASEIEEILNNTKGGVCVLCKEESSVTSDEKLSEQSLEKVLKIQQEHSIHTIRTLYEYFEPLFKKYNLDVSDLPHPDRDL